MPTNECLGSQDMERRRTLPTAPDFRREWSMALDDGRDGRTEMRHVEKWALFLDWAACLVSKNMKDKEYTQSENACCLAHGYIRCCSILKESCTHQKCMCFSEWAPSFFCSSTICGTFKNKRNKMIQGPRCRCWRSEHGLWHV